MKDCDFCKEYRYANIEVRQNEEHVITEIGVKLIIYRKKKNNPGIPPGFTLGRIHALNYCPMCGHNFAVDEWED